MLTRSSIIVKRSDEAGRVFMKVELSSDSRSYLMSPVVMTQLHLVQRTVLEMSSHNSRLLS